MKTSLTCIALLGLFYLYTVSAQTPSSSSCCPGASTLSSSGTGTSFVTPNRTHIQLAIQDTGATAAEAQSAVSNRTAAVIAALTPMVTNLQTVSISLSPVYDFSNNTQVLTGYQARNTLAYDVSINNTGASIDTAVGAGANNIDSVQFLPSETDLTNAQNEALRRATDDAMAKGRVILSQLNRCMTDVKDVSISSAGGPRPFMPNAFAAAGPVAPTPVLAGRQTVEASVTLTLAHAPCSNGTTTTM